MSGNVQSASSGGIVLTAKSAIGSLHSSVWNHSTEIQFKDTIDLKYPTNEMQSDIFTPMWLIIRNCCRVIPLSRFLRSFSMKYDHSGIILDGVLYSKFKSKIVQRLASGPKGRNRKICDANNDSTASTQRPIRTANPRLLPTTTRTSTTNQTASISGHLPQSTANQRVPNGVAIRVVSYSLNEQLSLRPVSASHT